MSNASPLKLQGVNVFVKPSGRPAPVHHGALAAGREQGLLFRRAHGRPAPGDSRPIQEDSRDPPRGVQSFLASHFLGGPFASVDFWVSIRAVDWPDQDFYLRVKLNAPPLPQIPNWYRGDIHYHSGYTDNPAERGYPLDVTKQAAIQAGTGLAAFDRSLH